MYFGNINSKAFSQCIKRDNRTIETKNSQSCLVHL